MGEGEVCHNTMDTCDCPSPAGCGCPVRITPPLRPANLPLVLSIESIKDMMKWLLG
ncbi:hypothetical protein SK128_002745, partial [Halocaridina rubra]